MNKKEKLQVVEELIRNYKKYTQKGSHTFDLYHSFEHIGNIEKQLDKFNVFKKEGENYIITFTETSKLNGFHCFDCGKDFSGTIIFDTNNQIFTIDKDTIKECKYDNSRETIKTKLKIKNQILFSNFFKEMNYEPENMFSLNNSLGRLNIALEYEKLNVANCQTGNMSVKIYKDISNSDIFVLEYNSEKYLKDNPNLEYMGTISCEVWSFVATCNSTYEKNNWEHDFYQEPVIFDVEEGEYEVTYNWVKNRESNVIAHFTKIA